MKKIFFIFSIFLFIACATDDDKAKIDGANQFVSGIEKFNTNKALLEQHFNFFEAGKLDDMMAAMSEDLVWYSANGDTLSKPDYVQGMNGWHSEFENFKFIERQYFPGVDDSLYIPNGSVRVYGIWKYNHKATKMDFSTKYYGVAEFNEEGLQTVDYEYFDVGGIFLKLQQAQ
tara:strand:- start:212 stop:730 length:519 start_codon:yes stop_codon:yes gene_type:complete